MDSPIKIELDKISLDSGTLLGLLSTVQGSGFEPVPDTYDDTGKKQVYYKPDWFSDPWTDIGDIPRNPARLLALLGDIMGDSDDSVKVGEDLAWYKVSDAHPFYLVVPDNTTADPAVAGVGLAGNYKNPLGSSGLTVVPYLYCPLFSLSHTGSPAFVLGDKDHPVKIGFQLKLDQSATINGKDFQALDIAGDIFLDGTAPGFEFNFNVEDMDFKNIGDMLNFQGIEDWFNQILNLSPVKTWLTNNIKIPGATTLQALLNKLSFLKVGPAPAIDLSFLNKCIKASNFQELLGTVFKALLDALPPVQLGDLGEVAIAHEGDLYGIRVQMHDVSLIKAKGGATNTPVKPKLLLQLGKYFTGEADDGSDSWLKGAYKEFKPDDEKPGVSFYFLSFPDGGSVSFKPRVELVSIGLDYEAGGKTPLVNIHGFQLKGFEGRGFMAMDLDNPSGVIYGGGLRVDKVSLPLGAAFKGKSGHAGGDNPVASNLLASGKGSEDGNMAPKGKTDAVNPEFSISASYVDQLHVQLYGPDDAGTDTIWFPIQRHFGPLDCRKLGVGWHESDKIVALLFDGSAALAGLSVDLEALSIGIPVTAPDQVSGYKLDLDGLAVEFKGGPVEISGGLLKNEHVPAPALKPSYDGQIFIKAGDLGICGLGSYAALQGGGTSFFAYAVLDYPLGGPSFFFITGLAAGFGYNRSLKTPNQDQVAKFPLVAALDDPGAFGGDNVGEALQAMDDWIRPARGEYWLAGGIKFTSFDIINSDALAAVEFGKEFEVLIMGLSKLKLPMEGKTYVDAELMLELVVKPDDGLFSASAVLSPHSFVIDPACKLTGGFAFMLWFGNNPHAGDFVVTLGGYHPSFKPPAWYPSEPRLGFNWPVSGSVTIKGGAYFALTPSAGMAGGSLDAQYHSGNLKAWFTAYTDVLVHWKPFYFDADIGVSVGASYRVKLLFCHVTLKVELGASLELWGPPTGGKAHVHWYIISFTVGFGADKKAVAPVTIDQFKKMLPQKKAQKATENPAAGTDTDQTVYIHITPGGGLSKKTDSDWVIRPDEFSFSVGYTIPETETAGTVLGEDPVVVDLLPDGQKPATDIYIRAMGGKKVTSKYTMTITGPEDTSSEWEYTVDYRDEPVAMWGPGVAKPTASADLVKNCVMGIKNIKLKPHSAPTGPPEFPSKDVFEFDSLDKNGDGSYPPYLPLENAAEPIPYSPQVDPGSLSDIKNIAAAGVVAERTAVYNALAGLGIDPGENGDLANLAANPGFDLEGAPMEGQPADVSLWKRFKGFIPGGFS